MKKLTSRAISSPGALQSAVLGFDARLCHFFSWCLREMGLTVAYWHIVSPQICQLILASVIRAAMAQGTYSH